MTALFAGLTTLDVLHRLDHVPDPLLKVTSTDFTMAAGGPATNAAVTYAALSAASCALSDSDDEAGATSCALVPSESAAILLTALGEGPVSAFLAADLAAAGVRVLDATALSSSSTEAGQHPARPGQRDVAPASSPAGREPAVSSIIEHPSGRMVASTNARLDADTGRVAAELPERVGAVLIDGHNPALAHAALTLGVPDVDGDDPFAPLEARPPHPRILDGGSWKDWLTPLLGFVDIAVVSEDFAPPLMVERVGGTLVCPRHAHRLALDRDAAFALDVHTIEVLVAHLARLDDAGQLEHAVRERRLPMIDMGDDAEVTDLPLRGVGRANLRPLRGRGDGHVNLREIVNLPIVPLS